MKLPLSNRLLACCAYVAPGDRVADVGCDHGYLGIHLLQSGIARSVIASDVNEAPLQSALHNAVRYGVKDHMTFYLSDGVRSIPRDFDCLVCAGLGGDTMISILESAPWLKNQRYRLILQCQSKRPELRRYLCAKGWSIRRETLAQDGKFLYPVMEAVYAPGQTLSGAEYYITPALLADNSPLLPAFLNRVIDGVQKAADGLARKGGEKSGEYQAIVRELRKLEESYGNRS